MLGRSIKRQREERKLDRQKLANAAGISIELLTDIENGDIVPPVDAEILLKIADQFQFAHGQDFVSFMGLNRPRKFQAYVLGLAKTGTVSLTGVFGNYWTDHEFDQWDTHQAIKKFQDGLISRNEFREYIIKREAMAGFLELDSAHFNRHYIDILAEEYPQAKFICLIRECHSWVNSFVNYFTMPEREAIQSSYKRNGLPFDLPRGDNEAKKELVRNFHKYIDGPLSFWADQYNEMLGKLRKLPSERYMIIKTNELSIKIGDVASFIGIPADSLVGDRSHLNRAEYHIDILKKLDTNFLEEKFNKYCSPLMKEFFPDYALQDFLAGNSVSRN